MLPIEHRAYHLYREDAYYEYCMLADQTASYDCWGICIIERRKFVSNTFKSIES